MEENRELIAESEPDPVLLATTIAESVKLAEGDTLAADEQAVAEDQRAAEPPPPPVESEETLMRSPAMSRSSRSSRKSMNRGLGGE